MFVPYILDLIIVALAGVSIYFAYRKGMIRTLFSLAGGVVAIVLALYCSAPVSAWVNRTYIDPAVHNAVLTAVNGSKPAEAYDEAIKKVDVAGNLQKMPDSLRSFLETMKIDVSAVQKSAEESRENSIAAREALIDSIASPVSKTVSKAITLIGLFILFFIALFIISRLLEAVFKVLPFGKKLNRFGGVLFGVLRGCLLVLIFCAVLYGLACGNVLVSLDDLDHTYLLKWINQINPFLQVIKGVV